MIKETHVEIKPSPLQMLIDHIWEFNANRTHIEGTEPVILIPDELKHLRSIN